MFTKIVLLAVLAKLAVATHPAAGPRDLHARQTDVPAECSTIFEPLFTDLPQTPPEFASYWENNIPGAGNKTCMEPAPTSLYPVFESVYGDYATWWQGKTADLASIASKCFPDLAGGGDSGDVEKRTAPPPIPSFGFSLPAEWATLSDFDFASLLPEEWQAYLTAFPHALLPLWTPRTRASSRPRPTLGDRTARLRRVGLLNLPPLPWRSVPLIITRDTALVSWLSLAPPAALP
jgi:hypothetical protein